MAQSGTAQEMVTVIPVHKQAETIKKARGRYAKFLVIVFVLSLPLVNPSVRGDGVGYYAYVRSLLIEHSLHFDNDWLAANSTFIDGHLDADGHLRPEEYAANGYIRNHYSVGPSILWAPSLIAIHAAVLVAHRLGAHIQANGYSRPYLITMAVTTALYGFLGLLLAFDLARRYVDERWVFLAALGVWFASSMPVYMYLIPSYSHAHSAFAVALFLWYWHRTRGPRSFGQWFVLALAAGLMLNVYYPNGILLLIPALEAVSDYRRLLRTAGDNSVSVFRLLGHHALFIGVVGLTLFPTFVTRHILYGTMFESGYPSVRTWFWTSPALLSLLFSSDHGMLSWTPILLPAIFGLILFCRRDRLFGSGLLLSLLAYYYFIASYPVWDGETSFGNRFFISFTPAFIIGLATTFDCFVLWYKRDLRARVILGGAVAILVVWNLGFMYQWGTQMLPSRGPILWSKMVYNQFTVVPQRIPSGLEAYFLRRKTMMRQLEQQNLKALRQYEQQQKP